MAKKVLVTGAAGLIGRELCKQLSSNFIVIGVDNGFRYPEDKPEFKIIQQNLTDYLQTVENDFDFVFHMSAINGTKYFYDIPTQLIENNITSDLAIFNFMQKNSNSKLIYASSSEIVAGTIEIPTPELVDVHIKNIHNPRWSYRLAKMLSENYLMNSQINFLIVRFFNVFGKHSGNGHFIKDIIDKIHNEDYSLIGATETRSFCRVEDAVDAVIHIYDQVSREIINIGSDEEISVLDAANIIAQQKNKTINWKLIDSKLGSVARRNPSLKKLLKYYPTFKPKRFKDSVADL
jgi:dTDP-glucose 4,6-dehydratase/UDP-glucose 4-epimerase